MTILTAPKSVIHAKAQIALLHEEIDERLNQAQANLIDMADAASTPEEIKRLREKAKGVAFVAGSHVEQIKLLQGPLEVRLHIAQLEERIHTGGWGRGFEQGVELATSYIRGYLN